MLSTVQTQLYNGTIYVRKVLLLLGNKRIGSNKTTMTHELPISLTVAKNLGYIPAFLLGLSTESYAILGAFMAIDMLLGIARVYTINGGVHIKSYKAKAGVISKLTILALPLLIVYLGKGVGLNLLPLAQWAIGAFLLAEFYSIVSNIYSIRLGKDIEEFDAVSFILKKIQKVIERLLLESSSPTVTKEEIMLKDHEKEQ